MFTLVLISALVLAWIAIPRYLDYVKRQKLAAQIQAVYMMTEPPLFMDEFHGDACTLERMEAFIELYRMSGNPYFQETDIKCAHYSTPRRSDAIRLPFTEWRTQVQNEHLSFVDQFKDRRATGFTVLGDSVRYSEETKRQVLHNQRTPIAIELNSTK